jgi:hypothetical protein
MEVETSIIRESPTQSLTQSTFRKFRIEMEKSNNLRKNWKTSNTNSSFISSKNQMLSSINRKKLSLLN